jgi:beta-phosphoglucomutase
MKYKGVIFDFNGVLLWDGSWHNEVWADYSKKVRGSTFTDDEYENVVNGRGNRDILSYLLGRDVTQDELREHGEAKESAYQNVALSKKDAFTLSPGAVELLNALRANNTAITIGTSAPLYNVRFYFQHLHLDKWFEIEKVSCDDGTVRGKPAPDIYVRAAQKIGVAPEECIVIDDAETGVQAAVAAHIGKIIGLGTKERHVSLIAAGAHKTTMSLEDMTLEELE